jgi:hypothetical protein
MPHRSRLRVLLGVALAFVSSCAAAPLARAAVPHLGRVFLIVGENTSYEQITARHAPFFIGTIKPGGAWVTDYHAFKRSSSLGQYVAMVSGQFTRCEAHNDLPDHCHQRARNLFAQLAASGRSWRDWEESMTNAVRPDRQRRGLGAQHLLGPSQPGPVLHRSARRSGRRGDRSGGAVPHRRPADGDDRA